MHDRRPVTALIIFCLGLACAATLAQNAPPPDGPRIVRVRIKTEGAAVVDMVPVRAAIRVREGDLYQETAVARDRAGLFRLGGFKEIRTSRKPVAGGVELTYVLVLLPEVIAVRFDIKGKCELSEDDLRDMLEMRVGTVFSPVLIKTDLLRLGYGLRDEGHLFAEVEHKIHEKEDGVEILYLIEPGPAAKLKSVTFRDHEPLSRKELLKTMISVRKTFSSRAFKYDPVMLDSDLIAIREIFRRKGYLDATVSHQITVDSKREQAHLIVQVTKGPLYRVAHVRIRNATVFPPEELAAAMLLHAGEAFSQDQLDDDIETIYKMYGRKGHIKANVRVSRSFSTAEPQVSVVINLTEGPVCYIRKVLIRGNTRTKDHVARRAVSLIPGAIVNTDSVGETKRRLLNTGLFADDAAIEKEATSIEFLDTEVPNMVDALVEVNEGRIGEVKVGAVYGTGRGVVGTIAFNLKNFDALDFPKSWRHLLGGGAWIGGGQTLSLNLSPGTDYQSYGLSWLNPSVWDSPYSVGFSAYLREYEWDDYYDAQHIGGSVTLGRRFFKDLVVSLTPRVERIDISHIDTGAPHDARKEKGDHLRNSISLRAVYDKRDNVFLTSAGHVLSAEFEVAGTILGGDVDYFKEQLEARKWWTIWQQKDGRRHVLNVGGEAVLLQTTNSGSIPFFDRSFMGGPGTVRGFRQWRAGPIDPATRRQVGGEYRFLLNTEYEAPLFGDSVRGVTFIDTGLLERAVGDLRPSNIRVTAGVGLRLLLRGFPINIFVAVPLADRSDDRTRPFNVSIGTSYVF